MGNKEKGQEYRAEQRTDRVMKAMQEIDLLQSFKRHPQLPNKQLYYRPEGSLVPEPGANLYSEIENVLREPPLGSGTKANAYALHGAFDGYVLRLDRTELNERLLNTTMLYPVNVNARITGAPLLMNESGTIQIQRLVPGDTFQKIYNDRRDHYRLEYAAYPRGAERASRHAYIDLLKSLIAVPEEAYIEHIKKIVFAAHDGLKIDGCAKNALLENNAQGTHIHTIDFTHYDPKKYGPEIPLPDATDIMNELLLDDDEHRSATPQSTALYDTLKQKVKKAIEKADSDPEIRALIGSEHLGKGAIIPQQYSDSWLDREKGRALKDITSISTPQR